MADEMIPEPTPESVPAAQEPSGAVSAENNQQVQVESTAPVSDTQLETAPDAIPSEIEEWNGNDVDKLPKPLQARARGMLRYLHKVSQEASQVKQHAQAYQELTSHPEFQEFIQWKEQRLGNPAQGQQALQPITQEPLSEDDFLAAQTDPNKFVEVQQKLLMQQAQPFLQKMQALEQRIASYEQKTVRAEASQRLEAFASEHPDFWKINPIIMKATLEDVVKKQGRSIEDAYNEAKSLEKQYLEQAHSTIKQQVEAKKKAVTAAPSKSLEPEVIYVNNAREATKVAFDNARLGKRVDVRVKRK